jgi:hypothetical protein
MRQSMVRSGSALDNAVVESWHSTLEFELRSLEHFATRTAAGPGPRVDRRLQHPSAALSALGMMSPADHEKTLQGVTWLS